MQKIVVVGAGWLWERMKERINKYFEVVAIADNNKENMIKPKEAVIKYRNECQFMLCTLDYIKELRRELESYGLEADKITELFPLLNEMKYEQDREEYERKYLEYGIGKFEYGLEDEYAIKNEWISDAGTNSGHYFYQDILVAKKIIEQKPSVHVDIGSRIDGFITHLMVADIPVKILDIRPYKIQSPGEGIVDIEFEQGDATNLENIADDSIESLSTLHAVEHFGLGRYGDEVEPNAWLDAIHAMERVLAPGGKLYFSLPVGSEEKVCYNAHRIFSPKTIFESFNKLEMEDFFLLHEYKFTRYSKKEIQEEAYRKVIGPYDCGIWIYTKK